VDEPQPPASSRTARKAAERRTVARRVGIAPRLGRIQRNRCALQNAFHGAGLTAGHQRVLEISATPPGLPLDAQGRRAPWPPGSPRCA
jgi:hypothetical protein